MSSLWKPTGGGGGASLAGTAVDPAGAAGVMIDASEIIQPPATPAGRTLVTDGAGGWTYSPILTDNTFAIPFSHDAGVPAAGTRYLRYGQGLLSSAAGFRLAAAGRLRGITIQVNVGSPNAYAVEILRDPAGRLGVPLVIATLVLPAAALSAVDRTFVVAVTTAHELGARVVRTAGAGASTFAAIAVKTEWSIP